MQWSSQNLKVARENGKTPMSNFGCWRVQVLQTGVRTKNTGGVQALASI